MAECFWTDLVRTAQDCPGAEALRLNALGDSYNDGPGVLAFTIPALSDASFYDADGVLSLALVEASEVIVTNVNGVLDPPSDANGTPLTYTGGQEVDPPLEGSFFMDKWVFQHASDAFDPAFPGSAIFWVDGEGPYVARITTLS